MKYVLNTTTKVLHINGYCKTISNVTLSSNYRCFSSESEANKTSSTAVRMCTICEKSRENKLNKERNA
ncbi:MAG: hypothetical protein IKJ68_02025 [Clostridia bacterium]|nr:hypothetical protein [Clostridia bacterium]